MTNPETEAVSFENTKKAKAYRVTARDIQLLRLLSEYGCVDAQRIKAKLWNGNPTSRAHFRRLGILKKLSLIENVLGDQGVGLGYRISKHGQKLLLDRGQSIDGAVARRSYKTQFEHDQLLIDIRRILESSPVVKDFQTEAAVKNELLGGHTGPIDWKTAPTIPDGTFIYEVPGQRLRVALELEITQKSRARYFKIFRSHLLNKNWNMAFYILRDQAMLENVLAILEEVKVEDVTVRVAKKVNGIYLCALDLFLKDELKAQFTDGKKVISLEELAQLSKSK
jgi:cell fate (sporulation/competence/biofilm development) regulator YmcA (YheA/YmcA/DUF963 family)